VVLARRPLHLLRDTKYESLARHWTINPAVVYPAPLTSSVQPCNPSYPIIPPSSVPSYRFLVTEPLLPFLPSPSHHVTSSRSYALYSTIILIDNLIVIVFDVTVSVRFNSFFPVLRFCGTCLLLYSMFYPTCPFVQRLLSTNPVLYSSPPCRINGFSKATEPVLFLSSLEENFKASFSGFCFLVLECYVLSNKPTQ